MEEKQQPERLSAGGELLAAVTSTNIVHYERRAGQPLQLSGATTSNDVVFINEDTPVPPLPRSWPHVPFSRRKGNDDDVIYIGPE
jgi:hypothetical protein